MKSLLFLSLTLAAGALAQTPITARITPQALAKLQQHSPMERLMSAKEGEATVTRPDDQSIIKQSMILHDGKNWTLVPTGAVIFVPKPMSARVDAKPVGTLLPFTEFLTQNRAWITTNEVSFNQAAGEEPLPAERAAFWAKQDKIVIAVHQNGPISINVSQSAQAITQR